MEDKRTRDARGQRGENHAREVRLRVSPGEHSRGTAVAESACGAPFAESFQGESKAAAPAETFRVILNHRPNGFIAERLPVRMQEAVQKSGDIRGTGVRSSPGSAQAAPV